MPEHTDKKLAIWERIRDKVGPRIAALAERTRTNIPGDKSLAQFRTARPVPRQFYEILEARANGWVSEVYRICRDARDDPNRSETRGFMQAVFDFVIEPFIDEQLPDLLLRAAGFTNMERQLAKRGDRELKAYMPERFASLTATTSRCREVKEKVRSRWMRKLSGRKASSPSADTSTTAEPQRKQEFRLSSDGRVICWNGERLVLTPQRAQAFQILYDAYQSGDVDVSDDYILEELGSSNTRLRDTFRGSPLWSTLIVSDKKGMHRLDPENGFPSFRKKIRNATNTR